MPKRKSKNRSKLAAYPLKTLGLAVLATLVVGALLYLMFFSKTTSSSNEGTQITTADGKKVNMAPATPTEKQSNDVNKDAIVKRDEKLSDTSTNQTAGTNLVITDASASGARAYVSGVFEDGGSCTATATQGSQVVTASSSGFKNVSYTQCAPLNWPSQLSDGTWSISITYKSNTSQASAIKSIQI